MELTNFFDFSSTTGNIVLLLSTLFGWAFIESLVETDYGFEKTKRIVLIGFSITLVLIILDFVNHKPVKSVVLSIFPILFYFIIFSKKHNKKIIAENEQARELARVEYEKIRDREQWEEQLHREITREEALAKVRNTSMIELYKIQVELMMKYKREGANIDKDIFAMREKLLVLEGHENKAMIQDLMNTLNGL